jgi:hypothetical protein
MRDAWNLAGSAPRVLPLAALDVPVDVHVHGDLADPLMSALSGPWAWCERNRPGVGRVAKPANPVTVEVVADSSAEVVAAARGKGLLASGDLGLLLHELSPRVTIAAIEQQAGSLWMLHAACLASPVTGRAVALVAPSGMGKTTAASVLGRHLAYLTDETTALAKDGRVVRYPKPLSVIDGGPVKRQVSPAALGLMELVAPAEARLSALVLLQRDGTTEPVLEPVFLGEALVALAEQTSYLSRLDEPLHYMRDVLATTAGVFRARYAEIEGLLPQLQALLEKP